MSKNGGCIDIILICLCAALLLAANSCGSTQAMPHRACLYDDSRHWRSGTITEKREDGARLFRFDDRTEGDHGYAWIDSDDRRLGPCRAADMDRFSAEHP